MTDKPVKPLKAYSVQADECGCIVFDTNSASARRRGANELDVEWSEVQSCTRAHFADQYAADGQVPPKALIDQGWWQSCAGCGEYVTGDNGTEDDDGNMVLFEPVYIGYEVFCSQSCKDCDDAEIERRAQLKVERTAAVHAKWPEAVVNYVNDHDTDATTHFSFPGSVAFAIWKVGNETLHLAQHEMDIAAWTEYAAMCKARNPQPTQGTDA